MVCHGIREIMLRDFSIGFPLFCRAMTTVVLSCDVELAVRLGMLGESG